MVLNFSELYKDGILESKVLYVCGAYSLFNNIAIGKMKSHVEQMCRDRLKHVMLEDEEELDLREFGIMLDYEEFIRNVKVKPFVGKWVCIVDYKMLSTKQRNSLKEYIKRPSNNGIVVVESTDYFDFKDILRDRIIKQSKEVNAIKLSFPSQAIIRRMVKEHLSDKKISQKAMDLFIMRMSNNYDEFETMINLIKDSDNDVIDLELMKEILKDIENYAVDDFLLALLNPPRGRRSSRKKLFAMMDVLIEDIGAVKLIKSLQRSIDNLLMFRQYINEGYIPGRLRYSLTEFKAKFPKDHPISKMSDFAIRKNIKIALNSSLRDLVFIKLLLRSRTGYSREQCERVLMTVMHRAILSADRLCVDIGIVDDIDSNLYKLNRVFLDYPPEKGVDVSEL